jgi:hypothetical protein
MIATPTGRSRCWAYDRDLAACQLTAGLVGMP